MSHINPKPCKHGRTHCLECHKRTNSKSPDSPVACERATKLTKGCVVIMKRESGLQGYGNPQCVSSVTEELGTISLYGHNQHYKDYHVARVISYPFIALGED